MREERGRRGCPGWNQKGHFWSNHSNTRLVSLVSTRLTSMVSLVRSVDQCWRLAVVCSTFRSWFSSGETDRSPRRKYSAGCSFSVKHRVNHSFCTRVTSNWFWNHWYHDVWNTFADIHRRTFHRSTPDTVPTGWAIEIGRRWVLEWSPRFGWSPVVILRWCC